MAEKEKKTKIKQINDLPGVGSTTADKLKETGFHDLMSIAASSPALITAASGVSGKIARDMINNARDSLKMGFEDAEKIEERRNNIKKVSTGSPSFNKLLDGGFESCAITEVYGGYGSGKTQLGHILSITVQKEDPTAIAFYIDTENTFRPDRIRQLAKGAGLDPEKALKNIKVARAYNSDHQMLLVDKAEELITQNKMNVKVLIVDSLTSHFRAEFLGRGTLADRQQKLNKHMHALLRLADKHDIVVFVTNQVMAKPDAFFGDPTEPIGGHIVGHNCIAEDSIIYTPDGLMKIKNRPKTVFSMANKDIKINQATNYETTEKMTYKIYANNIIEATEEHKFPILEPKTRTVLLKKVSELRINDKLLSPKRIQFKGEYQTIHWKLLTTYNNKKIDHPTILTENLAYLLGIILGDGSIDKRSIEIKCSKEEDLIIVNNIIYDLFKKVGKIYKIRNKNAFRLRVHSKEIVNNLNIKKNKDYFLNMISKSPSSVRIAFISGMIDTDGSLQREICISQADKCVLDYIQGMLIYEGIQSIIRCQKSKGLGFSKKNNLMHHLRVRSKNCKKLAKILTMRYDKRIKLIRYLKRKSRNKFYSNSEWNSFITYPIKKIEKYEKKKVIDLNVENSHTFIVNGICSHNSTFRIYLRKGKKGSRVAKLVDAPNLPDGETTFYIEEKGLKDITI